MVQSLILEFYCTCWTKGSNNTDDEDYEILRCNTRAVQYHSTNVWEEHTVSIFRVDYYTNPEEGCTMFLPNISGLIPNYTDATSQKIMDL
jgi:hypothetical protein